LEIRRSVYKDDIIKENLKADGKKNLNIRVLVTRVRKHLPQIDKDLALVKELLAAYEQHKTK
jgi:hypothetical protein